MRSNIYDGTKIETSSNKYTFVWKKAVTKNIKRLRIKIADLVSECNEFYGIKVGYNNTIKLKDLKKLRKKLYAIKKAENIEFVHGCGKRKTTLQCSICLLYTSSIIIEPITDCSASILCGKLLITEDSK